LRQHICPEMLALLLCALTQSVGAASQAAVASRGPKLGAPTALQQALDAAIASGAASFSLTSNALYTQGASSLIITASGFSVLGNNATLSFAPGYGVLVDGSHRESSCRRLCASEARSAWSRQGRQLYAVAALRGGSVAQCRQAVHGRRTAADRQSPRVAGTLCASPGPQTHPAAVQGSPGHVASQTRWVQLAPPCHCWARRGCRTRPSRAPESRRWWLCTRKQKTRRCPRAGRQKTASDASAQNSAQRRRPPAPRWHSGRSRMCQGRRKRKRWQKLSHWFLPLPESNLEGGARVSRVQHTTTKKPRWQEGTGKKFIEGTCERTSVLAVQGLSGATCQLFIA